MPILDVEIVGRDAGDSDPSLARRVADLAGEALGAPSSGTWVKIRWIDTADYAESGGGPPEGVRPVFVRVLRREVPAGEDRNVEMQRLTEAVARALGCPPGNVHVLYDPPAAGRLAFGGRPVT